MPTSNVRIRWYGPALIKGLQRAARQALGEAAIILQTTMHSELMHPGSGRFYLKSKAAIKGIKKLGGIAQETPHFVEATREGVEAYMAKKNNARKKKGKNPLNLREAGIHQASAPGEPPAPDTGLLSKVQIDRSDLEADPLRPVISVGTDHDYGFWLEFGTRKILPRPWAAPSMDACEFQVRQTIQGAVEKYVREFQSQ